MTAPTDRDREAARRTAAYDYIWREILGGGAISVHRQEALGLMERIRSYAATARREGREEQAARDREYIRALEALAEAERVRAVATARRDDKSALRAACVAVTRARHAVTRLRAERGPEPEGGE